MYLSKAIISLLKNYSIRNYSIYTLEGYARDLQRFMRFTGDIEVKKITIANINEFRLVRKKEGLKNVTLNREAAAIRSLASFCEKNAITFINPHQIDLGRRENRTIVIPTTQEIRKVIDAVDFRTKKGLRDRAILELLACSGIRIGELVRLDRNSIDFGDLQFTVLGKGKKHRIAFLTQQAAVWIRLWLKSRDDEFPALFISLSDNFRNNCKNENRGRLTPVSIQAIVRENAQKAGIKKKVTTHTFRHFWATSLLQRGADIKSVQELLGHSSLATTEIYLHLSSNHLKQTYEKCFS